VNQGSCFIRTPLGNGMVKDEAEQKNLIVDRVFDHPRWM
jgi:hypothetical protein